MDGASDQLLTGAGLSEQQYGRISGSYGFDQMEDTSKCRTLAHNSFACTLTVIRVIQKAYFDSSERSAGVPGILFAYQG